jgi:hypothetical protein
MGSFNSIKIPLVELSFGLSLRYRVVKCWSVVLTIRFDYQQWVFYICHGKSTSVHHRKIQIFYAFFRMGANKNPKLICTRISSTMTSVDGKMLRENSHQSEKRSRKTSSVSVSQILKFPHLITFLHRHFMFHLTRSLVFPITKTRELIFYVDLNIGGLIVYSVEREKNRLNLIYLHEMHWNGKISNICVLKREEENKYLSNDQATLETLSWLRSTTFNIVRLLES